MIDFRYHLISIVAVFLALGIGILMGSVVLDEQLIDNIKNQLRRIEATNQELRESNDELRRQIELDEQFALAARDMMLQGVLEDTPVVLLTYTATEAEVLDAVRSSLDLAGAQIVTTLEATEKLALPGEPERDELALITGAVTSLPENLREQAGRLLGERARVAAQRDVRKGGRGGGAAVERLGALVADLEEAGFLKVDDAGESVVPPGAAFVIVGGAASEPPFPIADFTVPLATALADPGVGVLAAEPSTSQWNLVPILRTDDDAQQEVTTVDQAQSTSGTIAVVLGLAEATGGCSGRHYGVQSGVTGIIPQPSEDC